MSTIEVLRRVARAGIAVCAAALLATTARAEEPAPAWSNEQWNLLLLNAWHTQGRSNYSFRQRWFAEYADAQRAYLSGKLFPPREDPSSTYARSLLEVEPALRFALARLFNKGDLSPPLRNLNAAGEPNGWIVLELTDRGDLRKARADDYFKRDAHKWIARGWMAAPDVLAADPAEQARRAYWPARTLDALAGVPAGLSADLEYGDGSTPLTQALLQGDLPLARALFARGASVHRCGIWGCPLTTATLFGKDEALAQVNWLLDQGARPDQRDPRCTEITDNPLAAAVLTDNRAVAERLLAAGAMVDGLPQERFTPLEFALLRQRQGWAEWLLDKGASALPREDTPWRNLASFAALTKDAALRSWAEARLLAAADKHPRYRLDVAVEQAGRRVLPDAQGVVALKAAPFELVFSLPAGATGVVVGASQEAAWLDEVRRGDRRNALFNRHASGALLSAEAPGSDYLLADRACAANVPADGSCDGAFMFLTLNDERRHDFHAERSDAGRPQYVRRVQSLLPLRADGSRLPVQRLAGQTLHLALAIPIPVDATTGATQLLPQLQTLKLQFGGQAPPQAKTAETAARPPSLASLVPEGWVADALGCRFEGLRGLGNASVRWTGDCRSRHGEGRGEFRLLADDVLVRSYTGSMQAGRFSGPGVLVTAGGIRYEGTFVEGQMQGKGQLTFADGTTGTGSFKAGQLTGDCTLTWARGDRYDGRCRDGWPGQSGQILFANGDKYQGAIGQAGPSGPGRYTWANGDVYEGEFGGGQPAGTGEYRFTDGSRYTGHFRLGVPWGRGRVQLADGTSFEGDVDHGRPGATGSYAGTEGSPLQPSPALRARLQLRYADAREMTPSWVPPRADTVCARRAAVETPQGRWTGRPEFRAYVAVRDGRVASIAIQRVTPADDEAVNQLMVAGIEKALRSYQCSGDRVFEQSFSFAPQP